MAALKLELCLGGVHSWCRWLKEGSLPIGWLEDPELGDPFQDTNMSIRVYQETFEHEKTKYHLSIFACLPR